MSSAVLFQIQSFAILTLLFVGVAFRKQRQKHIRLMSLAMLWDILLILQIELTRDAIHKASQALSNPMMLNIHVSLASLSVIGYLLMTYSGYNLWKNNQSLRPLHRTIGWTTLTLRTLTFITSFFAVSTNH